MPMSTMTEQPTDNAESKQEDAVSLTPTTRDDNICKDAIEEKNDNPTNSFEIQDAMPIVEAGAVKGEVTNPTREDLNRIKEELNRTLNEEQEVIKRQMDLILQKQNIKMAIEQVEIEEELRKLMIQRDRIEQVRVMHS